MSRREKKVVSKNYVGRLQRFPIRKSELDRFKFGKEKYYEIARLKKNGSPYCLDIACGAKPFPEANVLCDLHLDPVPDRSMKNLVTQGKPFVLCNCYFLPFKDRAFEVHLPASGDSTTLDASGSTGPAVVPLQMQAVVPVQR